MFEKIAMFLLMGAYGVLMLLCCALFVGACIFGLYSAFMSSPIWTGIGALLFIICGVTGQRRLQGEIKK